MNGKKLGNMQLPTVELQNPIKSNKLQHLSKLLVELSGENWVNDSELTWLEQIFTHNYDQNAV